MDMQPIKPSPAAKKVLDEFYRNGVLELTACVVNSKPQAERDRLIRVLNHEGAAVRIEITTDPKSAILVLVPKEGPEEVLGAFIP